MAHGSFLFWEGTTEVLDDFNKPEQPQKTLDAESSAPSLATNAAAPPSLPVAGDFDEDAFLKQLEADMANLMGGGGGTGGGPPVAAAANNAGPGNVEAPAANQSLDTEIEELSKMLKDSGIEPEKFLGALLAESMKPGDAEPKEEAGSSSVDTAGERGSFQDTIRQTMNRMQESGDRATAAATTESDIPADLLAQLIQAMEAGTSAEGEDADINKLFAGMMEQLSNKEMLYEPMKELHTKFGPWLEENRTKVSAKDRARYETHAQLVGEIVAKFDEEGYSDDKPEDRSYIWDRMQAVSNFFFFFLSYPSSVEYLTFFLFFSPRRCKPRAVHQRNSSPIRSRTTTKFPRIVLSNKSDGLPFSLRETISKRALLKTPRCK
jgi:peroxin-19